MSLNLNGLGSTLSWLSGQHSTESTVQMVPQSTPGRVQSQYRAPEYDQPVHFSFCDATAHVIMPFLFPDSAERPMYELPGLQLISGSSHRDTYPVVSGGRRGISGFTKGHRTCAGTLGFTVLGESPWATCMRAYGKWRGLGENLMYSHPDELPPFDILITFMTEAGDSAFQVLRSVQILDRAQNINLNDIQLSQTFSFLCAEITELINLPNPIRNISTNPGDVAVTDAVPYRYQASPDTFLTPADPVYTIPTLTEPVTP